MHLSEQLDVLPAYPLIQSDFAPSDQKRTAEKETAAQGSSANPNPLKLAREKFAILGVTALTGIALAALHGSFRDREALPQYEGKFQLIIEPLARRKPVYAANQFATPELTIDYETQARVLWSPKVVEPVVRQLQADYPDLTTDTLLRNLTVTHEPGSNTLSVTYRDVDRARAQIVLQQLAQSYLSFTQACHGGSCRALQRIEQLLPQLQQQIVELKQASSTLKQFTDSVELAELGHHLSRRADILAQQQNQLQIQMSEAQTRLRVLQKQLRLSNPSLANDLLHKHPQYQQRLTTLRQVTAQGLLLLDDPKGNRTSLNTLQQQQQQLFVELAKTAQAAGLEELSAIRLQNSGANVASTLWLQTFQAWVETTFWIQVIQLQQQAIAQSEQRVKDLTQQWAVVTRQYDAIQVKLQIASSQLMLYQQQKKVLEAQPSSQLAARLVAPPETSLRKDG